MERLTNKREADAQREEYERRLANGYPRNIPEERFLRLAAYEDTHMMPSDVTSMRMDMAIIAALFNGVDVDRMKELAEVDKDGRLVVLPCKDCAHYDMGVCLKIYSDGSVHPAAWQERKPDDFCSYGERKDGES